jgi:hypothetical protein
MYFDLTKDHSLFETLVRSRPDETDVAIQELKSLILNYHFFPTIELSHKLIGESLFMMANMDLSLVSDIVRNTGFRLRDWNDAIMERLLGNPVTINTIESYLSVGFSLSDLVVKRTIATGKPFAFEILGALVPNQRLCLLAQETIHDLFGPYLDRENSLNILWNSSAVQRIIQQYKIKDQVIEKALLDEPDEHCTFEKVFPNFPVTRPYLKSKPYAIWKFILENYGPHHRLTMACFDDAISRAVSDQSLHHLIEQFLDAGVVLRPRHVKIMACRALHRNMTNNALRLISHLRKQVVDRYRKTLQMNHLNDHITQIHQIELMAFQRALQIDLLENNEWKERSRTVQLGGGSVGGAYRIDRTPQDVVKFTEEGQLLAQFINQCDYSKLEKEVKPKAILKHMTFLRRAKMYRILT